MDILNIVDINLFCFSNSFTCIGCDIERKEIIEGFVLL